MKSGLWARLDVMARNMAPLLLTLLLLLLTLVQTHIQKFGAVMPMFVLISVYYWAIYRPDLMPMFLIFLLGILHDLLGGGLVGLQAFILLAAYGFVSRQRRFFHGKSFGVVWWGFMLVGLFAAILQWGFVAGIERQLVSPWPVFFSYLLSVAFFPIVALMMVAVHRTLPLQE